MVYHSFFLKIYYFSNVNQIPDSVWRHSCDMQILGSLIEEEDIDFEALMFPNLVQLEIAFGTYFWDLLTNLIQNSHKLEVLIISKVCSADWWFVLYYFVIIEVLWTFVSFVIRRNVPVIEIQAGCLHMLFLDVLIHTLKNSAS